MARFVSVVASGGMTRSNKMRKGKFKIYRNQANGSDPWWYFTLTAANGKVIADSELYDTKQACMNGIKSVIRNAANATIEEMQ